MTNSCVEAVLGCEEKHTHLTKCSSMKVILTVIICLFSALKVFCQQEHKLLLTERRGTDGHVTVRSIPADPKTYLDSGTIPSNLLFQQPNGLWTGIAADYHRSRIIWSDANLKLLWRGNVTHPQATPLYTGTSYAVGGVAIDWMTGNVYWSDDNYNWIMIVDPKGNTNILIDTALEIPGGIAVYPERNYIYWINRGTRPKIERSNLAGENRLLVATANVRSPRGIAVDHIAERIYWTDSDDTLSTLESCDLNGNDRITEFSLPAAQGIFHDVTVFQNYVYITDWTNALRCILKEERQQYFSIGLRAQPYGITIFAPQTLSSQTESPCRSDPCGHICVGDGYSNFKCLCRDGFILHEDGTTCTQEDMIAPPIVIVAFKTKICWYPGIFPDMETPNSYTDNCLLHGQGFTAAVAIDEEEGLLFYSDIQTKSINRILLQNYSTVEEVIGARGSVEGLAVDWLSQNIYWTDNQKNHISVSRYDGRFFKVLIENGVSRPRSIAVDPHERVLFWTQFGPPAEISKANLDGSGQVTIVYNRVLYPSGLAVDYIRKRLYFADTGYGAIQVVDYDGQNREIFTLRRGKEFFDLTLFRDYLMWTEWKTSNGVHVLNKETKDTTTLRSHIMTNEESVYGIASFSKHRQRGGNGPCGTHNGGCEQLCLPSGPLGSYICACVVGYKLHEDGFSCTSEPVTDNFLLLTDTYLHGIYQLDMTKETPELSVLPLGHLSAPLGVGFDPVEEKVYWSDTQENAIIRANLNGEQREVIIGGQAEENVFKPHSLAVEPSARLVFWTDIIKESIMVSRLDGTRKKTLVTNLTYPRDVAISGGRGTSYMFWTSWGESAKIERSFMDGTGRRLVVNESLGWPYSLTIDVSENKLYWTDAKFHTVEVSDFLGLVRQTLTNLGDNSHPFGIVIYNRDLYWTDWIKGGLSRVKIQEKHQEENEELEMIDVASDQLARPNYIHAFTKATEANGNNVCIVDNGGCSGLCIPVGFSRTCACADGVQLLSDWETCQTDTEEIFCPVELLNGQIDDGCQLLPGFRCSYQCHEGYRTLYPDMLCLSTGLWRQEASPFCEEIYCSEPQTNSDTIESNCSPPFDVGDMCSFQCKPGYQEFGPGQEVIICNNNGEWSGQPLDCRYTGETETTDKPDNSGTIPTASSLRPQIIFTTKPENVTIEIGATDLLQHCVANDSYAEITWYKDGHKLPSDIVDGVFIMARGQLFIPEIKEHHAGKYACRAQLDDGDYFIEAVAHLTFQPDTIFQVTPNDAAVEAGNDHVFECAAYDPTHIIQWKKDGVEIKYTEAIHKVPMTDNLLIRKAVEVDSGSYKCVVLSFDRTQIAEATADLIVIPSASTGDICGTITQPRAVAFRAAELENNQDGRIVNGSTSIHGGAPWMARLWSRSRRSHFCGGNLINRQWIVTAGHCIRELAITEDDLLVRLGDFDDMSAEKSEALHGVSKIKLHHKFDYDNFDRDVALVKLARPVEEFTDYIRPICLLNSTYGNQLIKPGVKGLVVGWGRVAEDGHYARYMKEVKLPIRGKATCKNSTPYLFSKNMFCAGNPKVKGDACEGDSGGPFAVLERGRWYLVGLVSWGEGCAREGKYGFYTKLPKFYDWIQAQVSKHS